MCAVSLLYSILVVASVLLKQIQGKAPTCNLASVQARFGESIREKNCLGQRLYMYF